MRQVITRAIKALCFVLTMLVFTPAAHADDCWQLSPDANGGFQNLFASLPRQCFPSASAAIAYPTGLINAGPNNYEDFPNDTFWNDNFSAIRLDGTACAPVGDVPDGYVGSCTWSYTRHHVYKLTGLEETAQQTTGLFYFYLIKCPPGTSLNLGNNRCVRQLQISLLGPSSTHALPAGPALPQKALVTSNGVPVPDASVSVSIEGGNGVGGNTDNNGIYSFTYTPPRQRKATARLTADCTNCTNVAQKQIQVEGVNTDTCSADPGSLFGNPLSGLAAQKVQDEADWQDAAAHPLSVNRHYRSGGTAFAGWGPNWSHDYVAQVTGANNERAVRLGTGSTAFFRRETANDAWVHESRKDSLTDTPTGALYTRQSDESRWVFDAAGKLQSITARNGWAMTMAYNAAGQLASVTNAFGRTLQFAYSASGQLVAITTPDGKTLQYGSDAQGRLTSAIYPDGTSRGYLYEDLRWPQALTGISDEAGVRFASFAYDDAGRAISTTHAGNTDGYNVNYGASVAADNGSLISGLSVNPAIYRTTVQVTDPQGNAQSYVYQGGDGTARLIGASGAYVGGSVSSRDFASGTTLPASESDFMGVLTTFSWDLSRQLKLATTKAAGRPEAQTTNTQWHPAFRLPVLVTEAGRTTASTYDNFGNKIGETVTDLATGQARTWAWTYNAQGLNDSMTDPRGGIWRYTYSAAGNRTNVINPKGEETRASYDAAGRVLTQSGPNRPDTTLTYDARGRLLTQTTGGETSAYAYTPAGLLASATLPSGYQVTYSYDQAQRLTAANDNLGAVVQYTLDAMGNRIREDVKDANGNIALTTARVINSLNKVAAIQGAAGQTTALTYDANGEAISATDPLNQTTRQTLDALRRPTATTFADNAQATQAWNQLDQLTQVTDPKAVATQYTYNAFGEVLTETSPDIGTISYTRDVAGDVIAVQDAKGQITNITRDALGRPTEIRYAADHISTFAYNAAGDVTRIDDKSGSTTYERDAQGRITAKTQAVNDNPASPSLFKVQFGYAAGQLSSVIYPSGLKVFYKRTSGRITGIDVQEPGGTLRNPKPIVGFVTNLTHTPLGQPKAWSWSNGDSAARTFDADGRMASTEFASYQFDAASRITGITQSLWASRTVTQTIGTTTTTITELYQTPLTWTAGYDNRDRLTSFAMDGAATSYSYDANSNRLTAISKATSDTDLDGVFEQEDFTQTTSQALNVEAASNRLLGFTQTVTTTNKGKTKSVVVTPVNYSVDANGAMTSDGLRTFDYDSSNRLSKVKIFKDGEAASVSYLHNSLGQRVFKGEPTPEQTLPNQTTLGTDFITWLQKNFSWLYATAQANTSIGTAFIYGDSEVPAWAQLGSYDNGSAKGAGRSEYIWLPTEDGNAIPVGLYRNSKFFAIHTDHLGTPRAMTNEVNTPVWQWPYSAFGNNKPTGVLKATPNPKAAITNKPVLLKATGTPQDLDLGMPGQTRDTETGSFYNYFRHYDANTGSYWQFDPSGLNGGYNRRGYVDGNALSGTDAFGLANSAAPQWMRPAQPKSQVHDYEWKVFRCMGDCTQKTMQELLCNPAPSAYPKRPTKSGDINMVSLGGFELGPVTTAVSPTTNTTWNLTMPSHLLHPGWVKREVVFDGNATWIVNTGGGDGFNPLNLNSTLAPIVWGGQNPVKDTGNGCSCSR